MDIKGHWTWFQMIQFPIWPVLQCQCWQTSTKSLLQCCPVPLLPCQPLAGGKTWGGRRRKGRSRGGVGGGEARELHRDAGQHMHGWEPGGAQICKGDFNPHPHCCDSNHFKDLDHFFISGNSQTEERFKLNAKAGQEKTRGASDNKVFLTTMMKTSHPSCF